MKVVIVLISEIAITVSECDDLLNYRQLLGRDVIISLNSATLF